MAAGALNARARNSPSGSIGRAPRASTARKIAPASAASANPASTSGAPKPRAPPSIVAATSAVSVSTAKICPPTSTPRPRDCEVSPA